MPYLRCTSLSEDTYLAELKDEYDYDRNFHRRWRFTIDRQGKMDLPSDLLGRVGWKDDDLLEWFQTGTDEFLLVKIGKQ